MGEVAHAQCYNRSGWRLLIGGALAFMVVFRAVAGLIGMFRNMTAVVNPHRGRQQLSLANLDDRFWLLCTASSPNHARRSKYRFKYERTVQRMREYTARRKPPRYGWIRRVA